MSLITLPVGSANECQTAPQVANSANVPVSSYGLELTVTYEYPGYSFNNTSDRWTHERKRASFDTIVSREIARSPMKMNAKLLAQAKNHLRMVHAQSYRRDVTVSFSLIVLKNVEVTGITYVEFG